MVGNAEEYAASAAVMLRIEAAADDSLLAILALSKFGIAITAIVNMMATTISSSIKEKPLSLRSLFPKVQAPDDDKQFMDGIRRAVLYRAFGVFCQRDPEPLLPQAPELTKSVSQRAICGVWVLRVKKKEASDCSDAPIRFTSCAFAKT